VSTAADRAAQFRALHAPGRCLLLANCWDAASARVIESCGAPAVATTSAGVAWAHGYPDGDALPASLLVQTIGAIARMLSVPLSVDVEGGYSSDPAAVGDTVAAVIDAGAVGINIEDGSAPPELLCRKIETAKRIASRAGIDLFVNARTDVFRGLVPSDQMVDVTIERARLYREAGCDGVFAPGAADPAAIRALVQAIPLPVNVMVFAGVPSPVQLRELGVRRVSAGSAIAQAAYGVVRRATAAFLDDGRYEPMIDGACTYRELNALIAPAA
jgi:2-methylisocitrate lyase-like PEP mutase family enzyme